MRLTNRRLIGLGILLIFLFLMLHLYAHLYNEGRIGAPRDSANRFLWGYSFIRTGVKRSMVDRVLPQSLYERVSFRRATGDDIMVFFPAGISAELRDTVASMPRAIESFDELTPVKSGLIISFKGDTVDGLEWKLYKEGVLREQTEFKKLKVPWLNE
ncbi:MAG TPA: hypothetical protein PKH07_14330 [bacterium]|nr:hypothetical protein [bacterium]